MITSSWNTSEELSLGSDEVLFTFVLKAKSAVQLRDALGVNSRVTSAEAYSGEALKSVDVRIVGGESRFALLHHVNNPIRDETVVCFEFTYNDTPTSQILIARS